MSLLKPRPLRKLDERLGFASTGRSALAKIFPDHWSFMLGEIAMYSFILLVVTGTYLALFFEPSSATRLYDGSYKPMDGQYVSGAFASSVELSWDVPGGLLMRQAHHWLAHIFIGSIVLHLCRIFFTAMFRRPARAQLGRRRHAAAAGDLQRVRRLLAARRPALGHRPADLRLDRRGVPVRRRLARAARCSAASSPAPRSSRA